MVFKFILEIIIFLALGAVVYFLARALPRVNNVDFQRSASSRISWMMPYLEKTDKWLQIFLERFLRRLKILVMRLDNWVSQRLAGFKKEEKESGFSLNSLNDNNKKEEEN